METLNCLGMRCPLPVIALAKELSTKVIGSQITLLSDDPASEPDLKAWARMTGNSVVSLGANSFEVTKLAD
ncbi:SirA Predicted redox protein, regulator of disulfide bond formation [actinobacterium SCGC AAA044-D11]|uniref:Unannotated protein n=1 Tax=freshwater metagenome TaxID=449393 RepID=A0A6J6B6Q4_9ZZZZ|nr:aminotransferase [Actinomycetota bacterium]MTA24577.1 aminotransferase [Actinomycetota bacterium]